MRKNFYWSEMKGCLARQDQLKFSMRGGLLLALLMKTPSAKFASFLPKQKGGKDSQDASFDFGCMCREIKMF